MNREVAVSRTARTSNRAVSSITNGYSMRLDLFLIGFSTLMWLPHDLVFREPFAFSGLLISRSRLALTPGFPGMETDVEMMVRMPNAGSLPSCDICGESGELWSRSP